jgi:hypothetical protein
MNSGMMNILSQATIIKMDNASTETATAAIGQKLGGDVSWAEGLLD